MKKHTLQIKGMHCRSCEILIEEEIKKIAGVSKTLVSHRSGSAEIYFEGDLDHQSLQNAVSKAGYQLETATQKETFSAQNKTSADYGEIAVSFLIAAAVLFVFNKTGLLNVNASSGRSETGFLAVLLIGLTAGFSTCMALIGGLVLGASARYAQAHPDLNPKQKLIPHLWFNFGRIAFFTVLGGVIGFFGSLAKISPSFISFLTITAGLVMLFLGFQLVNIFPVFHKWKISLPKQMFTLLGINRLTQKEYGHANSLILGGLSFFLPCGFTQAMQIYAVSTGSFFRGSLIMGLFALGTAPGLLSLGGLTAAVKVKKDGLFFRTVGAVIVILALFNIMNGLNLLNVSASWPNFPVLQNESASGNLKSADPNVTLLNGVQVARMQQVGNGYKPNKFTVKANVPVRWIINSTAPYSCASSLIFPAFGLSRQLQAGENVLEFKPTKAGTFRFSCSMGMYTGLFKVVDDNNANALSSSDSAFEEYQIPAQTSASYCARGGCGCGAVQNPQGADLSQ